MTGPPVPLIEGQAVGGQKPMHDPCQRNYTDPNSDVKVIPHQTVSEYFSSSTMDGYTHHPQETAAIALIGEDVAPVDASGHAMIDRAGKMYSRRPRHP
jgi:hypothetical protein